MPTTPSLTKATAKAVVVLPEEFKYGINVMFDAITANRSNTNAKLEKSASENTVDPITELDAITPEPLEAIVAWYVKMVRHVSVSLTLGIVRIGFELFCVAGRLLRRLLVFLLGMGSFASYTK